MKRLAIAALCLGLTGQTYTGVSVGTVNAGVVARIDCRSFGQTAQDGGSLNIKYATPMMCWATRSTVSGVAVNDTDWVPEVWFDWDWDDSSLGTVSRGGLTVDLGKSIGLVAAHAFKPSTYAETCNGGTNSSHTVTLTVYSLVAGVRESSSATLTVCVENPATTWPNPVAYCDDADCSNDSFVGVVNPGTPTNGGNGTDLATILGNCSTSKRVLVEGGVTFSTGSTGVAVGAARCLVESYGGSKSKLRFTSVSSSNSGISVANAACGGFTLNNVTLAGSGTAPRIIAANTADRGCYAIIDSNISNTVGEEFSALTINDPIGNGVASEQYFIKFDYTKQADSGLPAVFLYNNYTAFVGGEISGIDTSPNNNEHNIRLPQWEYVVIDSMLLKDQEAGRHLIALRQDCGTSAQTCTHSVDARIYAITRNELRADDAGTTPVQICTSGTGGSESTKCYDGDVLRNMGALNTDGSVDQFFFWETGGTAFSENKRIRVMQNALDMTGIDTSTASGNVAFRFANGDQHAFIGNVLFHATTTHTQKMSNTNAADFTAKDNGTYETGSASYDMFSAQSESADNIPVTANPFSVTPGTFASFDFTDVTIANGSAFDDTGVLPVYPKDVNGGSCDSLYDVGAYCTP